MKTLLGALSFSAVLAAAPVQAASDFLLEIEGIKGESTSVVRPGTTELLSWSWGLSTTNLAVGAGSAAPKVVLQDFNWVQAVDATAPRLLNWATTQTGTARDLKLYSLRTDASSGTAYSFFEIAFPDTLISSLQLGAGGTGSDLVMQLSASVPSATMLYRRSATATPVTGSFTVVNDRLSFSGDADVLEGFALAVNGPAPVPEPASWALMLGGLGVAAWMARRRGQAAT
jgi:type VI secretion system secreted protein Hcp